MIYIFLVSFDCSQLLNTDHFTWLTLNEFWSNLIFTFGIAKNLNFISFWWILFFYDSNRKFLLLFSYFCSLIRVNSHFHDFHAMFFPLHNTQHAWLWRLFSLCVLLFFSEMQSDLCPRLFYVLNKVNFIECNKNYFFLVFFVRKICRV